MKRRLNRVRQRLSFLLDRFYAMISLLDRNWFDQVERMMNICLAPHFQKLKIIYIMEYLLKNSDEDHAVTTSQIIAYLKSHDITAERKTIYSDIDALRDFGLDIIQVSEGTITDTTWHAVTLNYRSSSSSWIASNPRNLLPIRKRCP